MRRRALRIHLGRRVAKRAIDDGPVPSADAASPAERRGVAILQNAACSLHGAHLEDRVLVSGGFVIDFAANSLDANSAAPTTSTAITTTSGTNFTAFSPLRGIAPSHCASNASATPANRRPTFVGGLPALACNFRPAC